MKIDFEGLNPPQVEAVNHVNGPLLIIAGAGSGKTKVLTNRIAYLVSEIKVKPYNILAITFTNKAAKEMKERAEILLGSQTEDIWISTFHAACVRILRRDIEKINYQKSFVIFDTSDQKTVIKECLKELNIDEKLVPHQFVLSEISKAKNTLIEPDGYQKMYGSDFRLGKAGLAYELYQKKLKQNNALDFDDIIMKTIQLFLNNPDVLAYYQSKFKYIMVDEYQDTNMAQFTLVSLLSAGTGNLCVVGDDDQSIYGWRGADITNILEFEKVFPGAKVIKLEQNYRSTGNILDAANHVIKNNKGRKTKKLWTENGSGEKIIFNRANNEHEEAITISRTISKERSAGRKYSDFAILYRLNAQSRVLEEILMSDGIPYKIFGGLKFYDRKEIRDIIAYLRFIYNPSDMVSLKRIINEPKRGIGKTTIENLQNYASENEISIWQVLDSINEIPKLSRAGESIAQFAQIIRDLRIAKDGIRVSDFIKQVLEKTGYIRELENEGTIECQTRIENLMEFISVAIEFEKECVDCSLDEFLENISLVADIDGMDENADSVVLMTLHSAKGLEFPIVFVPGMEEGVFPGYRSLGDETEIEEERRLCYVGITRAREKIYLSSAQTRTLFGNTTYNKPSRFLNEIPESLIDGYNNKKEEKKTFSNTFEFNNVSFGRSVNSFLKSTPVSISAESVETDIVGLKVGVKVSHRKFGNGVITKCEPEGNDLKLDISFERVGTKRLMAQYANLEVL
jgi:DNA helicase II / ATP-dependent DNA helicase PcrA